VIPKTLEEFRRAVKFGAGIGGAVGAGDTFRYPLDELDTELNVVIGEFREEMYSRDFAYFLTETEQADLPTERADDNEQYSVIDWPTNVIAIKRVDVYVAGKWEALEPIDWSQIRQVTPDLASSRVVRPLWYAAQNQGETSSTEEADGTVYEAVAGKIALVPFHSQPGSYKLTVLYRWVNVLEDDELIPFPSELGFQWCVQRGIEKVSERDRNAGKRGSDAAAKRKELELKIGRFIPRAVNTGPVQIVRSKRYHG